MFHRGTLTVDMQWGSSGKGLLNGYLAIQNNPDTVFTANGPNSGHVFKFGDGETIKLRQLPNGIISANLRRVMFGPGAIIDLALLQEEINNYQIYLQDVDIFIHENACIVTNKCLETEKFNHLSNIGSTQTGTGAAVMNKLARNTDVVSVAKQMRSYIEESMQPLGRIMVVNSSEWISILNRVDVVQIEGAQGFGLSIHHGSWPHVTSRDCSPTQIMADCGIPISWYLGTDIYGVIRTYPIRVNNKTGSSGPCYPDQKEISFADIGQDTELTTTTNLPRRIFTFSEQQFRDAYFICKPTRVFINFMNYLPDIDARMKFMFKIDNAIIGMNCVSEYLYGYGPTAIDISENLV